MIDEGCPAADKATVLATLKSLTTSDSKARKELDNAIKELEKSLGNLHPEGDKKIVWIDSLHLLCKHGYKAFDHEKKAVHKLSKVTDPALQYVVNQAISDIVQIDRLLAQTAINEAPAGKDKDKAIKKFNKGEAATDPKHKIKDYRNAWKYVNKHCEKDEKPKGCIELISVTSPNNDTVTASGADEVGTNTAFTDSEDATVVIHTSCSRCIYVGQVIEGWTITEIDEYDDKIGTLAAKCAKK